MNTVTGLEVARLGLDGGKDHRDVGAGGVAVQLLMDAVSIHAGHHPVEQHQLRSWLDSRSTQCALSGIFGAYLIVRLVFDYLRMTRNSVGNAQAWGGAENKFSVRLAVDGRAFGRIYCCSREGVSGLSPPLQAASEISSSSRSAYMNTPPLVACEQSPGIHIFTFRACRHVTRLLSAGWSWLFQ